MYKSYLYMIMSTLCCVLVWIWLMISTTATTTLRHHSLGQTDAEEGEHRGGGGRKKKKMEMLQNDVDHPPDQLLNDEEVFSGQISAEQILEFCDDSDLFPEPVRTPEASSCSGCYGEGSIINGGGDTVKGRDKNPSGYYDDVSFSSSDPFSSMEQSTITGLLNAQTVDDNIVTTIDYSASPQPPLMMSSFSSLGYNQRDQLEQIMANDAMINGYRAVAGGSSVMPPITFAGGGQLPLPGFPNFQEDYAISTVPDYLGLDRLLLAPGQGHSYLNQMGSGMPTGMLFPQSLMTLPVTADEVYPENLLPRPAQQDMGGMGFYGLESSQQQTRYGSPNLQMICENHYPTAKGYSSSSSLTPLATEMPTLDESTFKTGKISPEERKQKIHRYLQKKHERNFNKKIKYACRKTLADSRPRVRGRFAKNDELTDMRRFDSDNHEDEEDEVIIKEEEATIDTNSLLAQLNTFKCNYSHDGWN